MKIDLTLPEPPSSNRYYRTFHNRVVRSAEANKYRADVWAIVHTVTLYAFGAVIAGACALLLYISGRAVITGKL